MAYLRNKSMEFLKRFEVPAKNPSEDAQRRWREAVGTLVKNRRRRFRMVPDLDKRSQVETERRNIQEKLRVALYVQKAALQFIDAARKTEHPLPEMARECGFSVSAEELATVVRNHDAKALRHHMGVDGVARKVNVSLADGVKSDEVGVRAEVYGANQYTEKPPRTFWMFLWDACQDMTLLLLAFCAFVSVAIGLATEGWPSGMYDGLGIVLTILLVVMITAASDYNQSLQFRDLDREKKKIDMQVTRDGYRQKVSIYDIVVGDIVHLSIGDQVPADGLYIDGYSLVVDESSLSGESEPVHMSSAKPFLLGGTKVHDGSARMLVTAVGMRTEWGNLMETLSQGGEDETPLQVKLNGVATIIGKIGLVFAVLTFTVLMARFLVGKAHAPGGLLRWRGADALSILNFFAVAVTIIVVAVPEGLPLAVTLSLAFAMKKLMEERALVRHLSACETMGSASCICTDKTGTLTTNHMVVEKVWASGAAQTVSTAKGFDELRSSVSENFTRVLLEGVFHCSGSEVVTSKDGRTSVMGTPTETAILEFGLEVEKYTKVEHADAKKLKVEPFNSVKKTMAVVIASPNAAGHPRAFLKGASEVVLSRCGSVLDGTGAAEKLTEAKAKRVASAIDAFACEALRTLCLAYQDVGGASDVPGDGYTLIAVFGIKDPLRPGVREAVRTCHDAGINVRMVTGDNINTAKAIARECGILTDDGVAIEGPEFRAKSPNEMRELIPKIQVMARSLPLDKHTLVTNLRGMFNEVVAVTGDGTNDAPALHEADIGLAMGIAGTEVAKENADVIIMDDNFSTIINVAKWGRSVYINIQKFVQFQLTVNVVALMVNFVSASFTGSAPLTIVQLLWVNLIMDTLGALALATEPPNDAMMRRPPVGRGDNFITKVMWRNIIGQSMYQLLMLGVLIFKGKSLLRLGSGGDVSDAQLNTFIFNTFVFCQVFNEVNSRDMEKVNVFSGIFSSWIFPAVAGATAAFQVIIVEFLGTFASTVHLSGRLWLASMMIGSGSLLMGAGLKFIPVDPGSEGSSDRHDGYQPIPTGPNAV
ncbi:calcium-transporting ATPase 1, plasma membrane-type [Zea mays]|uniref:Calcium-transporting ATPase n=1 Tax=Zea mays TaxID=4577 RepID=A0A1D6N1X0_MAIZE|nr:calcium-transporting ATPase 1, plasma membrane-type [Zea mays]ONM34715.1 Calcium-transporting ATPase 2 plasma membrane-type [Zea mays]|eukprot:XP_008674569.1 calcium-transporting ATPase 1, plasma membrane-type [Zea mays]